MPVLYPLEGVSGDATVFALGGVDPQRSELPRAVYLCRKDGILLRGWLNHWAEGSVIGHVEEWHRPASTLVKGEKVFILPGERHESHR